MTYYTTGCPHSYATINAPAEMETTDWEGVTQLIEEFDIPKSEAIEWIEGMGYELACEELTTSTADIITPEFFTGTIHIQETV